MLQKIYKHIDKHTLKPQELILIACVPESAKRNVILNAETFDMMIQCMPEGSKKAQYILNKNLLWKETEVDIPYARANAEADIMFCTQCNEGMKEDEVRVIVVAIGL